MALADVLVLRTTESHGQADVIGRDGPGRDGTEPTPTPSGDAGGGPPPASDDDGAWPATLLPALLGRGHEEEAAGDGVHRYRGARLLYTAGCRSIDVTASPSDVTSVRLTLAWRTGVPPEERAAVLSWWRDRAVDLGWRPADRDDVVGAVEVERYVPTDAAVDDASGSQVVLHDWARLPDEGSSTSRTSGRRT